MTQSRLAQILAEETPPFRRRETTPLRRRRRFSTVVLRRTLRVVLWLAPVVALLWWSLTAPEFSIRSIEINGDAGPSRGWVASQLGQHAEKNLLRLELDELRRTLLRHPWVEEVRIRKQLPDRLNVTVFEHLPRGLLVIDREEFLVASDGLVFSRRENAEEFLNELSDPSRSGEIATGSTVLAGDQPLLRVRFSTPLAPPASGDWIGHRLQRVATLFETLDEVSLNTPSWRERPVSARILGGGDFELDYGSGVPGILISAASAAERARLLERLRPQIDRRYEVAAFDLRFTDRIVLRGAHLIEQESLDEQDVLEMTRSEETSEQVENSRGSTSTRAAARVTGRSAIRSPGVSRV